MSQGTIILTIDEYNEIALACRKLILAYCRRRKLSFSDYYLDIKIKEAIDLCFYYMNRHNLKVADIKPYSYCYWPCMKVLINATQQWEDKHLRFSDAPVLYNEDDEGQFDDYHFEEWDGMKDVIFKKFMEANFIGRTKIIKSILQYFDETSVKDDDFINLLTEILYERND